MALVGMVRVGTTCVLGQAKAKKKNKIRHNTAWCETQNGHGTTRARALINLPLMLARSVGYLYTYINATTAC